MIVQSNPNRVKNADRLIEDNKELKLQVSVGPICRARNICTHTSMRMHGVLVY